MCWTSNWCRDKLLDFPSITSFFPHSLNCTCDVIGSTSATEHEESDSDFDSQPISSNQCSCGYCYDYHHVKRPRIRKVYSSRSIQQRQICTQKPTSGIPSYRYDQNVSSASRFHATPKSRSDTRVDAENARKLFSSANQFRAWQRDPIFDYYHRTTTIKTTQKATQHKETQIPERVSRTKIAKVQRLQTSPYVSRRLQWKGKQHLYRVIQRCSCDVSVNNDMRIFISDQMPYNTINGLMGPYSISSNNDKCVSLSCCYFSDANNTYNKHMQLSSLVHCYSCKHIHLFHICRYKQYYQY